MKFYRVVKDDWLGFEVQEKTLLWPFWRQSRFSNTHDSLEKAEKWAVQRASGRVVRYLGKLPK